jgi:hypothetical protein
LKEHAWKACVGVTQPWVRIPPSPPHVIHSHPEEHHVHRLRKTAGTNWLRSGFDLMKIKTWLAHKSLKVTQIYLDSEMHDPEGQKTLDRAGEF